MSEGVNKVRGNRIVLWGIIVLTVMCAALSILFKMQSDQAAGELVLQSRSAAIRAVSENVLLIENKIGSLTKAGQIAGELSRGELQFDQIKPRLNTELQTGNGMSMTVAWLPEFAPGVFEQHADGVIYFIAAVQGNQDVNTFDGYYSVSQVEDETHGDISNWYRQALNSRDAVWISAPYKSPVSNSWWSSGYSAPFSINGELAGVVAAELTLEQAGRLIFQAENEAFKGLPLEASFGMLISADNTIISHPDRRVIQGQGKLTDFFPDLKNPADIPELLDLVYKADSNGGKSNIYELSDFEDTDTGQLFSVFFAPVSGTGWWVSVVLDQTAIDRSMGHPERIQAGTLKVAISVLALAFFLTLWLFRVDRGTQGRLWPAAIVTTFISILGIAWILTNSFSHSTYFHPDEVVLKNRAISAKSLMKYQADTGTETVRVPTGVFVQSAEFSNANDVSLTGFVWQIYDKAMPVWLQRDTGDGNIKPGFIFPESEQTDIDLRYQDCAGNRCVYGWYFTAVLRQEFDYRQYPFDLENVWIRMWHSELGRNVILIPDLDAYTTLDPLKFPGLELADFVLEGWDIQGSYFSYRHNSYNTDFGINDFTGARDVPELYFNITLKRSFLNAFIMNFITLTVAAFLLFAVLHTIRTRKEKRGLLGFNVSGVLAFCAALFFVVIIAHTSLRESLSVPTLVYLEYYFFAMYIAFLGVSVNAITVASENPHPLIRVGDNLVARLLFWPLLSFALLVATLVIFY